MVHKKRWLRLHVNKVGNSQIGTKSGTRPKITQSKKVIYPVDRSKVGSTFSNDDKRCFRCSSNNHLVNARKFKNAECRKCKRVDHIAVAYHDGKVPRPQHQGEVNQNFSICNEKQSDVSKVVRFKVAKVAQPRPDSMNEMRSGNEYDIFEIKDILKSNAKSFLMLHNVTSQIMVRNCPDQLMDLWEHPRVFPPL